MIKVNVIGVCFRCGQISAYQTSLLTDNNELWANLKNHYLKTLESDLKQENIGGESTLGIG